MAQINARLFGGFEFRDASGAELKLNTRKTRGLLAFLIVEADRWHTRDRLAGLLWSDRQQAQARHSLTQALSAIRKLGEEVGLNLIEGDGERVRFLAQAISADVLLFREKLESDFTKAAELYTGPFLDDFQALDQPIDEWLATERAAFHEQACTALAHAIEHAEARGDMAAGIAIAKRWVALDPVSEAAHRTIMRLCAAMGEPTAAVRQYQACEQSLRDGLGVPPSSETQALLETIRSGLATAVPSSNHDPYHERDSVGLPAQTPMKRSSASIAVLPFENLSADPDQDFLCDGIADDIINMLSAVSSLRVIARQSTSRYRGQRGDLRRVAEDLGVRYVLGGSVRRSGNRLRISAQLIDAHDESQIWADRYDRNLTDIFDIQDEVMKEVVTALQVKLTTGEDAIVQARGTKNVEAWKYCILARNNLFTLTAMHHLEARKLAQKAIEIDPNYAYPWMILGMSYMREGRLGQSDRTAALQRAEEYVDKALSLDGALGLALGFKAGLHAAMGDPVNGVQAARRAIALHPGDAQLRNTVSFALSFAGEYEEALENAEIAVDLNPFATARFHIAKIRCYALLERFEEAIATAEKVLEEERGLVAPLIWLAYSAHCLKQLDRAEKAVKELTRHAPHFGAKDLRGFLTTPDTAAVDRVVAALRESGLREDT